MKKSGLFQLLALVFISLSITGCVHGGCSSSHWKTFDGIMIVVVSLFLILFTLATMRSSKH
ncbi:MAG: hypothetical protein V4714_04325 [Bacteroidota bacterium]